MGTQTQICKKMSKHLDTYGGIGPDTTTTPQPKTMQVKN